jgi:curved DNA-binding protein CbpA
LTLIPERRGRGNQLYCEFDGLALELRPQDLSLAGVFVVTTAPPALDRELDLLLRSPIGEIALRGQVVQVISRERAGAERRQPGFGVLFVDLADDQRAFIGLALDAAVRAAAIKSAPAPAAAPARTPAAAPAAAPAATPAAQVQKPASARPSAQESELAKRRQQTLEQLERELSSLQKKTPWAMLGLECNADAGAVRQAYLALSKRFHPHVYAHLDSPEISRAATELFIAHKRAYTTLCSLPPAAPGPSTSEPPVDVKLPPAPKMPAVSMRAPAAAIVEALVAARAGASLAPGAGSQARSLRPSKRPSDRTKARSGRPSKRPSDRTRPPSPQSPRRSLAPAPMEPAKRRTADAEIALAHGVKHLAASRFDEAAEQLERALALCPTLRDASVWLHVCRARKHRAAGRSEQAVQEYRALLAIDPEHREALEQAGGGPQRRRAGLIGKWFGPEDE